MMVVLTTLDGCKVRFDDPQVENEPPLHTYMLPMKGGGFRSYDFHGSQRDEDGVVVRCYEERPVDAGDERRVKRAKIDGTKLVPHEGP